MKQVPVPGTEVTGEFQKVPTRKKQEGRGLELDVIKKIGAQLDRLEQGSGSATRVVAYVQSWANEQTYRVPAPGKPPSDDGLDL